MTESTTQREANEIAFNAEVIREFREHRGQVGGQFADSKLLILGTTGAKTGHKRFTPLAYLAHDDRFYVFAAGPYAPHHPHWYFNLVANPDVTVEINSDNYPAKARVLAGNDRERIWDLFVVQIPQLPEWQRDAEREFPIVELTRNG